MALGRKARTAIIAVAMAAVLVTAGIGLIVSMSGGNNASSEKLQVVASFYPLYYFSSQIGGDRASVSQIIPDGVDPHAFEPSPSDVAKVEQANVLVYNGFSFEPWMGAFLGAVDNPGLVTVDTSVGVPSLLSDTVVQEYTIGQEALQHGINQSATASATLAGAPTVSINGTVLDVKLPIMEGGYGGYVNVTCAEEGDHTAFSTNATTYQLLYPNGTAVGIELGVGQLSQYPEFNSSERYDIPVGPYTLKIGPGPVNETTIVLVAIPPEVVEPGAPEHHHGLYDPHIWVDPVDAKIQVHNILNGFEQADPTNATYYQENAASLSARLDALNQGFVVGLQNRTKNVIITTHEGFDYMAQQYGFQAYGATGVWADSEPSAQAIAALADAVRHYDLHYVFSEPVYNDAVIQTIASETGTQVLVLDGIHGRVGVHAGWDYFQIMEDNLKNLKIGLEVTT
ncbi:MAG TPA: zinc ABC transporter substrate-binding protein [Methanomassiliicoccales archaeon]|nr:zinc ABC transporter substrate-binding protein [Methanomassiliicoccales archaeon]